MSTINSSEQTYKVDTININIEYHYFHLHMKKQRAIELNHLAQSHRTNKWDSWTQLRSLGSQISTLPTTITDYGKTFKKL